MKIEEKVSEERKSEMEKYGRTKTYFDISQFLTGNKREAFRLVNHVPAILDDKLDNSGKIEQLEQAKIILTKSFRNEKVDLLENWEKNIFNLGRNLLNLQKENFPRSKELFDEIVTYWNIEIKNLNRKGKILNSQELDKLNLEIGKSVGLQFLYLLCTDLNSKHIRNIASAYGLAIKLADNLSDIKEDIKQGYINISKENISKYKIDLSNPNSKEFDIYKKEEFKRIKKYYKKGDKLSQEISLKFPDQERGLLLFKEIAHSWLKQISEICFIDKLRKFDISNYKEPRFLSANEIIKMEKSYGITLARVIQLSYEQEVRNTLKNRENDPSYNPYFSEGISSANEKIKKIINKYPEIKEVLDLGCDDGERTLLLYSGKQLYGTEFVKESAKEAEKRGIKMYLGSMIKEEYPNKKFDMVSLLGEMVNFVGMDSSALLENAIKQIKDGGYFLVTCTHSNFDKSENSKYAIWSFKKSTIDKWLINEEKIPRAFLVMSHENLLKRIKNIAQSQNRKLTLIENEEVKNYYEDLGLGIYFFKKEKK